jgi:hypothetical protein
MILVVDNTNNHVNKKITTKTLINVVRKLYMLPLFTLSYFTMYILFRIFIFFHFSF